MQNGTKFHTRTPYAIEKSFNKMIPKMHKQNQQKEVYVHMLLGEN